MGPLEPAALSALFDEYAARLVLYARQWISTEAAQDVVQDAFVSLMLQGKRVSNRRNWLFRAVRNAALLDIRNQKRRKAREEATLQAQPGFFEDHEEQVIDPNRLQQALESLKQEEREIVLLRIWGGMKLKDVADIVNVPVSTAFSRYQAALKKMRTILVQS